MAKEPQGTTRRLKEDVQVRFPLAGDAAPVAGMPDLKASDLEGIASPVSAAPQATTAAPQPTASTLKASDLSDIASMGSGGATPTPPPGDEFSDIATTGPTPGEKVATTARAITGSAIEAAPIIPAGVAGAKIGAVAGAPFFPPVGSAVGGFTGFVTGATAGYFAGRELRSQAANAFPGSVGGNPEDLDPGLRPFAYSGEVIGGSLSFGTAFYGLARTGIRAGSGTLVQRMLNRTLEGAVARPGLFAAAEVSGTASAAGASFGAEVVAPGRAEVRVPAEIAAGFASPSRLLASTASASMVIVRRALTGLSNVLPEKMAARVAPNAMNTQRAQAVRVLQDYLAETGTDVKALREALRAKDIADLPLSAGQKTGDPALLALETGLARTDEKFRRALADGGKEALSTMRDMIVMLRGTGDPRLIKVAAEIRDDAIRNALMTRLETARQRALESTGRLTADTPEVREALSVQVFDAITAALADSRAVERSLWETIPRDLMVTDATIRDAFTFLDGSRLSGQSYQLPAKVRDFILHNLDEIDEIADAEGIVSSTIEVDKVLKFRTAMLDASRDAASGASPDRAAVRIYDIMADAALRALDDPDAAAELSEPLEAARSYSRALNDVFTRSFVGGYLRKTHDGGYARSPESMLRFATATGEEATNLNMQDIDAAMDFVARRSEVVQARAGGEPPLRSDAEVASDMATVMSAQERAMRIAASFATDPQSGLPKKGRLEAFKLKYASTLRRFPQVGEAIDAAIADRAELMRLTGRTADAERIIKKRAVLYKITGSENPSDAIRSVLNGYAPVAQMNQLMRAAKGGGPEHEEALLTSVFNYAIQRATNDRTGDIDLMRLRTALMTPRRPDQPSLIEMLRDGGLGDPETYVQLDRFLKRIDEITEAIDAGDVAAQAFDDPSAAFDFILRTGGAALGSQVSRIIGGGSGAGLIAASRGSSLMRDVFEKLPQGRTRAFLVEALKNPDILATMLEEPGSQRDILRLTGNIHGYILQTTLPGGEQVERDEPGPTGTLPRGGMFGVRSGQ